MRLDVAEMSLVKDFTSDKRGDPYPLIISEGTFTESVSGGAYTFESCGKACVKRIFSSFFPVISYSFKVDTACDCDVGISLENKETMFEMWVNGEGEGEISFQNEKKRFSCGNKGNIDGTAFTLTFRNTGVTLYKTENGTESLIGDFVFAGFDRLSFYDVFSDTCAAIYCRALKNSRAVISGVTAFVCDGISHADMKPIRYEDGTPIVENGRIFFTFTSRLQSEMFQTVISVCPSLCDFRMEGVMLFDTGDGKCCTDVASSVIFDRNAGLWYIWMCSFSHGHILGRTKTSADPRFGLNIIDVKLLEEASGENIYAFAGITGDEDPDLCFIDGKWNLTVCRLSGKEGYKYLRFVSDQPLDGFVFADITPTGGKTGGLMVPFEDGYCFVCGTDFNSRAKYDVYPYNDFSVRHSLSCNYDDGGFRGWGTVFAHSSGTRRFYYWITFDRHNASDYNWSYGNIYMYRSKEYFPSGQLITDACPEQNT